MTNAAAAAKWRKKITHTQIHTWRDEEGEILDRSTEKGMLLMCGMCGIVHTFHAFILSIPWAKIKSVIINNNDALQIFIEEQLPDRKRTIVGVSFFILGLKYCSAHTCVRRSSMPFHWNVQSFLDYKLLEM